MRQTLAFLSTYTADVSGVCSALYELGGMVVMHDPSGCNTTYNTHDEPRWYDQESLVFISGLSEIEAILGDDQKFIDDLIYAARQYRPAFIAIAGTPIPMMTGIDLAAIASVVEQETGIPAFSFATNGMHSYVEGAGNALAKAVDVLTEETGERFPHTVNLLGATPLDFSICGIVENIREALTEQGWKVLGTWAMNSDPQALKKAGAASVNLVLSSTGLKAAKVLERKFGTPYVAGTPCGKSYADYLGNLLRDVEKGSKTIHGGIAGFPPIPVERAHDLTIIGESVTARSLASALWLEQGLVGRVICPLETEPGILSERDLHLPEEEDILEALKGERLVIGDPIYRQGAPHARFIELPHEAYSGRCFRKNIRDLSRSLAPLGDLRPEGSEKEENTQ